MSSSLLRILAVCAPALALSAHAAEISVATVAAASAPQPYILIVGDIEVGDWSRFMRAIRANPDVVGVALGSGGGALDDGLAIARQIRDRHLDTMLVASCHSVCAVMFLAGDQKYVPPEFSLTVHSAYKQIGDFALRDPNGNATVAWFLGSMGYPLALARLWVGTDPNDNSTITWAMNDEWHLGFQAIRRRTRHP